MVTVWVGAGLTRRSCLRREARWFPPGWMRGRIWGWVIGTYADCTRWRWMFKYNGWCYPKGTCYRWPWWILVIICWYKISIDLFEGIALWRNGTHGLTGDVLVLSLLLLLVVCCLFLWCDGFVLNGWMIGLLMLGQQAILPSFTSRMNLNLNLKM